MIVLTHEEMLTAYLNDADETLEHFNPNHDPRNGQFAKGHGGLKQRIRESAIRANERSIKSLEETRDKQAKTGKYIFAQNDVESTISALKKQNAKLQQKIDADKMRAEQKNGQMAVAGALATIGGHMTKDYMTQGKSKKKSDAK